VIQDKQEWNTRETGVLSCAEQQMVPYRCNALYSIRSTMIQRCVLPEGERCKKINRADGSGAYTAPSFSVSFEGEF